jgi:hypothetical protein
MAMICIRKGVEVRKVKAGEAHQMVKQGWAYVPKSVWKQVRDSGKPVKAVKPVPVKGKK